jgi:hypothetical protein
MIDANGVVLELQVGYVAESEALKKEKLEQR